MKFILSSTRKSIKSARGGKLIQSLETSVRGFEYSGRFLETSAKGLVYQTLWSLETSAYKAVCFSRHAVAGSMESSAYDNKKSGNSKLKIRTVRLIFLMYKVNKTLLQLVIIV